MMLRLRPQEVSPASHKEASMARNRFSLPRDPIDAFLRQANESPVRPYKLKGDITTPKRLIKMAERLMREFPLDKEPKKCDFEGDNKAKEPTISQLNQQLTREGCVGARHRPSRGRKTRGRSRLRAGGSIRAGDFLA